MIRKQFYLPPEQDRKVKALAAQRGCTEAEIVREALAGLPNPASDDVVARLKAAGLLVSVPSDPDLPRGASARALEAEFERWLRITQEEHEAVLEAIRRGQRDGARRAMQAHIASLRRRMNEDAI